MRNLNLLFLLLWGVGAYAVTADNAKPLIITSDTLSADLNQHFAVFSGNVVATQGTRELTSNQTYMYFTPAGKVSDVRAVGSPAKSTEVLDTKGNRVYGEALTIEYFPLKSFIQYEQRAVLQENGNIFKGDLITYNIVNQVVASPETENNTGATTIILPPLAPPTKS